MPIIRYMSDLHLEFQDVNLPVFHSDYTILAGDILVKGHAPSENRFRKLVNWLMTECNSNVIYIPGNHEFYGGKLANAPYSEIHKDFVRSIEEESQKKGSGISYRKFIVFPDIHDDRTFLDRDNGIGFVGDTLWADFDCGNPLTMHYAIGGMVDHRMISFWDASKLETRGFLPEDALELHRKRLGEIQYGVKLIHDEGLIPVVISHHAPSFQSVTPGYEGHSLNGAFCTNLDNHVAMKLAKYWIHGHVHSSHDYFIGDCRVLCNPLGYPRENTDFNPYAAFTVV